MDRIHPAWVFVAGLVIGGIATAVVVSEPPSVEVIEGVGFASSDYDAIAIENESYAMTPEWRQGGTWNDSWPPRCVSNDSSEPRPLRMGIVYAEPAFDAPGSYRVAWLDCNTSGIE